jgi:hypothetical protein
MSLQVNEVLYSYDYPIVLTLVDKKGNLHICSAIEDYDNNTYSYFGAPINEKNLERLKLGIIDLREAIKSPYKKEWHIYLAGKKIFNNFKVAKKYFSMPNQEYLPDEGFFLKEIKQQLGTQKLNIAGNWNFLDFGNLFRRLSQVYTFTFATSEISKNQSDFVKFMKRDLKSGFDSMHFFNELANYIPSQDRLAVKEMKYASPGFVTIKADAYSLKKTYNILKNVSEQFTIIEEKYYNYYLANRAIKNSKKYSTIIKEKELKRINEEVLKYFAEHVFEIERKDLIMLTGDIETSVRLIFSVYRKVLEIVILSQEGKINL